MIFSYSDMVCVNASVLQTETHVERKLRTVNRGNGPASHVHHGSGSWCEHVQLEIAPTPISRAPAPPRTAGKKLQAVLGRQHFRPMAA